MQFNLTMFFQPRMVFFCLLFGIDVYDTYLHKYPDPPKKAEIHKVTEKGAFAKYEGPLGRLCWMIISYIAWFLLLQKNIYLAMDKSNAPLSMYEIFWIIFAISGFVLRLWCKQLLGKQYTYQITVYKKHKVIDIGPYSMVRHPGMLGILINLGGIYAWLNHWYGWCVYLLVLRDTYYHTLSEEKEFTKHLKDYVKYKNKVKARFVPFVW